MIQFLEFETTGHVPISVNLDSIQQYKPYDRDKTCIILREDDGKDRVILVREPYKNVNERILKAQSVVLESIQSISIGLELIHGLLHHRLS